jgi:hypothetical protein
MDEQGVSPQPPHVGAKPQSGRRRFSITEMGTVASPGSLVALGCG